MVQLSLTVLEHEHIKNSTIFIKCRNCINRMEVVAGHLISDYLFLVKIKSKKSKSYSHLQKSMGSDMLVISLKLPIKFDDCDYAFFLWFSMGLEHLNVRLG